jgi:hypothetical protein
MTSALLRLPQKIPFSEKKRRVEGILDELVRTLFGGDAYAAPQHSGCLSKSAGSLSLVTVHNNMFAIVAYMGLSMQCGTSGSSVQAQGEPAMGGGRDIHVFQGEEHYKVWAYIECSFLAESGTCVCMQCRSPAR